jgi:hypothetical protein
MMLYKKSLNKMGCLSVIIALTIIAFGFSVEAEVNINDTFDGGTYVTNGYYSMNSVQGADVINGVMRITATNYNSVNANVSKTFSNVTGGTLVLEFDYTATNTFPSGSSGTMDWIRLSNGATINAKVNVSGTTADKFKVGNSTMTAIGDSATTVMAANTLNHWKFLFDITAGSIEVQKDGATLKTVANAFTAGSTINKLTFGAYVGTSVPTMDFDNVKLYTVGNEGTPIINDTFESGTLTSNGYSGDKAISIQNGSMDFIYNLSSAAYISAEKRFTTPVTSGRLVVEVDVAVYTSDGTTRTYPYSPAGIVQFLEGTTSRGNITVGGSRGVDFKVNNTTTIATGTTANYWTANTPTTIKIIYDRDLGKINVYRKESGNYILQNAIPITNASYGNVDRVKFSNYRTTGTTKFDNIKIYTIDALNVSFTSITNNATDVRTDANFTINFNNSTLLNPLDEGTLNGIKVTKGLENIDVATSVALNTVNSVNNQCVVSFPAGLEPMISYKLVIPDTIKDTIGQSLSNSQIINFTTEKSAFSITTPSFYDQNNVQLNYNALNGVANLNAKINIDNFSPEQRQVTLVFMIYDQNNALKKATYKSVTVQSNQSQFECTANIDLTGLNEAGLYAKAFVWESLSKLNTYEIN